MEKLKKYLTYQSEIALIILGIACIFYGAYLFLNLKTLEETNKVIRMNKLMEKIYFWGGKYSILGLFEIIGIVLLYFGIKQFREIE